MKDLISNEVKNIEISGIRKFYNKVSKIEGAISLTLGQPDFPVPGKIKDAIGRALDKDLTAYTPNAGILELRQEISKHLANMDIKYNEEEICITIGGSEALMCAFKALLNKGDKVLVPTPAYPAYESCVKLIGGEVIEYNLKQDFSLDIENLKEIISKHKPKVMVLSYPSNPTGAIMSKEDRDRLHNIILDNNIVVISDEIYSSLCFYEKYYSISQFEDIKDKVIVVGGFSKMFSMTGLRIGYVCAASPIIDNIVKVHQYNVSCAPSICQWGAYEGLKSCEASVENMKLEFINRRDYLYKELKDMGFDVILPKGAFYIFPSIHKFQISSEEFCERLLKEGKVAVIPGNAFGTGGEGYIRLSYSYSMEQLQEAVKRIRTWLKENQMI